MTGSTLPKVDRLHGSTSPLPPSLSCPNPPIYNALATAISLKDPELGAHSGRCARHAQLFVDHLHAQGHQEALSIDARQFAEAIRLHDIGKIAVSDLLLEKPGKLTAEEYDEVKQHSQMGAEALRCFQQENGLNGEPVLELAAVIAGSHHERWDGKGYPQGLATNTIPIAGRIASLIDVYDSLCATRPYKKPFSHNRAIEIMSDMAPSTFDPKLYEMFLAISDKLQRNFS